MKGLLIKDLRILMRQKTTFLIIVLLGIFLSTNAGDISFSLGYMMMVSATLAISTLGYDCFENGMSFLLTLPINKKLYVLEKYSLSILVGLAVGVLGILLNVCGAFFGAQAPWNEFMATAVVSLAAAMLMLAYYIPIYMKYGPEKSRVALLLFVGVCIAVGYLAMKVEPVHQFFSQMLEVLENMKLGQIIGISVVIWALVMMISIAVSIRILEKKEF